MQKAKRMYFFNYEMKTKLYIFNVSEHYKHTFILYRYRHLYRDSFTFDLETDTQFFKSQYTSKRKYHMSA